MRPEPLRSEALQILDAETQTQKEADMPPAGHEDVGLTTKEQAAVRADEVTAVMPPAEAASAAPEPASATPRPAVEALRQKVTAARAERDKIAADLRKTSSELTRALAEVARLNSDNAELPALRKQVGELQATLAEERAEREASGGRVKELAETIAGQSARIREMETLHQQLAGADSELGQLRDAAAQLKQGVEAKCKHIAELQTDVSKTREEAAALRQQVESNEQAVVQLQDKLSAREAELTSLRAHFDHEAADLKKRADQEMWIVRRRLRRLQKGALLGGAVAACFMAVLMYCAFGGSSDKSLRAKNLAAAATHAQRDGAAANSAQMPPPALRLPNNLAQAPGPAGQAGALKTVAWSAPKVDEPPRSNATPPSNNAAPPQARSFPKPLATLAIPAAPAPKPAPARKVVTYTVKSGDTLWVISEKVLGKGDAWRDIAKENKISLAQAGHLTAGMVLTITVPASN
jgi:predicted  nucleic acid-binding Zn-ribbon protein